MDNEILIERMFQALTAGDRVQARGIVNEITAEGVRAEQLVTDVYWPTLDLIQSYFRKDQLSMLGHHFATRLLRSLADQAQMHFEQQAPNGLKILAACGGTEPDELASSMAVDLIEAGGYEISFAGGGVPMDEIRQRIGDEQPNILLLFSAAAKDLPAIRALVDHLHETGVCPELQIVVGGGVFSRAVGLAEEVGADLFIPELGELVSTMREQRDLRANLAHRTVGQKRKTRRVA